jgi:hypothetical protein
MAKGPTAGGGRVRTRLREIFASRAEIEASEERRYVEQQGGCTAIAQLKGRRRAVLSGVLRSVTLRPQGGVPALEAELYDGTGAVRLVWLGQRRIVGIEPGRRVRLSGFVSTTADGHPLVYNPRYELAPRQGE